MPGSRFVAWCRNTDNESWPMRRLTHKPNNSGRNRATVKLILCVGLAAAFPTRAADDLTALSLEQLMGLTVVGASKYE